MRSLVLSLALTVCAGIVPPLCGSAQAQTNADVGFRPKQLLQSTTTDLGQPIQFPAGPNQISSYLVELPPGGIHARHKHPYPIYIYVLEGTLTIDNEGTGEIAYPTGTAHLEGVNTWHRDVNKGTVPVRWIVVHMGQQGKPFTVRP